LTGNQFSNQDKNVEKGKEGEQDTRIT